jgi:amino acid transporter
MGESSGTLRKECLGFSGITAMAIALISPTMTAALIVPLMYSNAGSASWLAYLFGTVMLLFVALNLIQFAKRSTSAGSMYGYTVMGLGTTAGNVAGCGIAGCNGPWACTRFAATNTAAPHSVCWPSTFHSVLNMGSILSSAKLRLGAPTLAWYS